MAFESIRSWTVADTLNSYPQLTKLFVEWKTDCIGCYLNRFCTLEEVAAIYSLDLDEVFVRIQSLVQIPKERIEI